MSGNSLVSRNGFGFIRHRRDAAMGGDNWSPPALGGDAGQAVTEVPAVLWRRPASCGAAGDPQGDRGQRGSAPGRCTTRSLSRRARLIVVRLVPNRWARVSSGRLSRRWSTGEGVAADRQRGHLCAGDLDSGGMGVVVQAGLHGQAGAGGGPGDAVDDHVIAGQRPAAPVHRDVGEQPVLDLVPLGGARLVPGGNGIR
jgi:hypothetical protein